MYFGWGIKAGVDLDQDGLRGFLPLRLETSGWTLYGQWLCIGFGSEFPGGVSQALSWHH